MSYNLFFALLAIHLSQLLVQYKVFLLVDWISFLRLYVGFFLDFEFLLSTTFSTPPSHTGELGLNMFQIVLTLTSSFPTCVFAPIALISWLILSNLLLTSFMCSINCPPVDIVIPRYLRL